MSHRQDVEISSERAKCLKMCFYNIEEHQMVKMELTKLPSALDAFPDNDSLLIEDL